MVFNKIIPNRSNPVRIQIDLEGNVTLASFTRIQATFGNDTRDTTGSSVTVVGTNILELRFGSTTETSSNYWTIIGFTASDTDGLELTSRCVTPDLGPTSVCSN